MTPTPTGGQLWNGAWLTLAFLAELAALAALAHGGWNVPGPVALRVALAVSAPALAAVLWGRFAAPRASRRSPARARAVKVLVFGSAVLALVMTGHPDLAAVLAVVAPLSAAFATGPDHPPGSGIRRLTTAVPGTSHARRGRRRAAGRWHAPEPPPTSGNRIR